MIIINENQIQDAIRHVENLEEKQLIEFFNEFGKSQPVLLGYTMYMGDNLKSIEKRETLLLYACIVWKAYLLSGSVLKQVDEKMLENMEQNLSKELFTGGSPEQLVSEGQTFRQPHLLSFISNEVTAMFGVTENPVKPGEAMSDDASLIFYTLLVIINCLHDGVSGQKIEIVTK